MASSHSTHCPFCAIARGEDDAPEAICEGKDWIAFFPLEPATPGHTLIIPRKHVPDLWQLEPALADALIQAAIDVGHSIRRAVRPEGMNLITSAGDAAEQTVSHLHLHLVPRWKRDGFGPIWPSESRYEDESLGEVAAAIRAECSKQIRAQDG